MSCCVGIPLITIVHAPPIVDVPCPCEFSLRVMCLIYSLVDLTQTCYTIGDLRRFKTSLNNMGILACDRGEIDRPDLWFEAYRRSVLTPGRNFQQLYLELRSKSYALP